MATGGGKALPIIRQAVVFPLPKYHSSGKPCNLASILGVSRGMPEKSAAGASSAIPFPSTPNSAHACRALVGPKSGPPCFLLPPTRVGAILFAFCFHAAAPAQPLADMRSKRVSPTVGVSCSILEGKVNTSSKSFRMPIITTLGRNCGTP